MDSMRSLNRSLPRPSGSSTAAPASSKPPEALLQSFKDAALSVTKLYKEAASSQHRARQAGYQDALDDLLSFLDREDLGLGDGEGWKVRRWATERLDDEHKATAAGDESEEEDASVKRGTSPAEAPTAASEVAATASQATGVPADGTSAPKPHPSEAPISKPAPASPPKKNALIQQIQHMQRTPQQQPPPPPSRGTRSSPVREHAFTFRTEPPASMDVDAPVVRLSAATNLKRRRTRERHANTASGGGLGPGGGAKRKIAMADFFDLSDLKDFEGFGKGSTNGNGGDRGGGTGGGGGGGKRAKIN